MRQQQPPSLLSTKMVEFGVFLESPHQRLLDLNISDCRCQFQLAVVSWTASLALRVLSVLSVVTVTD